MRHYIAPVVCIFLLAACSSEGTADKDIMDQHPADDIQNLANDPVDDSSNNTHNVGNEFVSDRQINVANWETILREVVSIVNENPLESFMQAWQTPLGGSGHYIDFHLGGDSPLMAVDSGDLSEPVELNYINFWLEPTTSLATEFTDYSCTNGGTAKRVQQPFVVYSHTLTNCASASGIHSGKALRMFSHHRPFIAIGHYDNLTLVDNQQRVSTLTGRFRDGGNQMFIGERYTPEWIDVDFASNRNNQRLSLTEFNLARDESQSTHTGSSIQFFQASVKASFTVSADWTQQMAFAVDVDLSLDDDELFNENTSWQTGTVSITASDGSSLLVTLDPNTTSQFTIKLENGESIGPLEWSDGFEFGFSRHW